MTASQRRLKGIATQMQKQGIPLPPDAEKVRRAWRYYQELRSGTSSIRLGLHGFQNAVGVLMDGHTELKEREQLAPAGVDGPRLFAFCEAFVVIGLDLLAADEGNVQAARRLEETERQIEEGEASEAVREAHAAWALILTMTAEEEQGE